MQLTIILFLVLLGQSAKADLNFKSQPTISRAKVFIKDLEVELKYATTDNFVKSNLYGDLTDCYLQKDAIKMLVKADITLKSIDRNLRFRVYDCLRPKSVQIKMWDVVKGTKNESYVANPYTKLASIHNYGCAVDITLSHVKSGPLDMGTSFDFFGDEAQPKFELQNMAKGKINLQHLGNRLLLRYVMVSAGFRPISNEWWHFNCASDTEARTKYKIVE